MEATTSATPQVFLAESISGAWLDTVRYLLDQPQGIGPAPIQVQVTGLSTTEDVTEEAGIRQALDDLLRDKGKAQCETVASTIFPRSMWNPQAPRARLYERYLRAWPGIRRYQPNRRGTYFQRLIAYGGDPKGDLSDGINQLEHVITTWQRGNHRKSALESAIVDPRRDHVHSRRLGFPCLHQVSFVPLGRNGSQGLRIVAFYPTQYYVEKAYGNLLGLARLGQFVSREIGLELRDLVLSVSKAALPCSGGWTKRQLLTFANQFPALANSGELILGDGAEMAVPATAHPVITPQRAGE